MEKELKSKPSRIKRILKWTAICLILFIAILITIPILYKDKLRELVIQEANKSLTAKLELDDFDLTLLSTFPSLTIQLKGTQITGTGKFKGVKLASIETFSAEVDLWSVIQGSKVSIEAIHLTKPAFDVRILKDGTANYDIVKPDSLKKPEQVEAASPFELDLKNYTITDGTILYSDHESDMNAEIVGLNHSGKGNLNDIKFNFETNTQINQLSFEMDGVSYLSRVNTQADVNMLIEMTEEVMKVKLEDNTFKLNALAFSLAGYYNMFNTYDDMNLTFDAKQASFKDFLSLVPLFYHTGYESMITKGNMKFGGQLKGKLDDKNMPGWDIMLNVNNASIKYPGLPGQINNIHIDAKTKFNGGSNLDNMTLDVAKFHADFVGNRLDANLALRHPMTDPHIQSSIDAFIDLSTLKKVIPTAEGERYTGKITADINLNGKMSSIDQGNYEAFQAAGHMTIADMIYASKELNEQVAISTMKLLFSPQNLTLSALQAKTGKSDFNLTGTVDNYMAYVFRDELLHGNFSLTSNYIDLDQLMNLVPTASAPEPTEQAEQTSNSEEPFLVPDNLDVTLACNVNRAHFNGLDFNEIQGGLTIKDEVVNLSNLTMQAMGGQIGVTGSYSTVDPYKPQADFSYKLDNIDVQQLAKNFVTVQKLAPIAAYTQGKISSSFKMSTALKPNLEPIYTSISGLGDLFASGLTIKGFKPAEELANSLNMNQLTNQVINDIKAKFQFSDGKLSVKPFPLKLGKVPGVLSGYTSFDQQMNYTLNLSIPKELLPKQIIARAEESIAKLNGISQKLSINTIPETIPVDVLIGGTVLNPKITNNFKESLLKATGNLKENLVNTVKETLKDTAKAIINQKVTEIKEDLTAKKQALLAEAQRNADKVKSEAKKAATLIRDEAQKQGNELIAQAGGNPLKKKAAELAAGKLKKEADEKATKLEQEANQKADKIMDEAREKANKLN